MSASSDEFARLKLPAAQLKNLSQLGYTSMTPIQQQSLPLILEGRDVIGRAKTGSGKTCAFALGILKRIDVERRVVQGLVICPTRELAEQVTQEIRRLARALPNLQCLTVCGGKAFGPQKKSLEKGAHIVVGTPGRLMDHLTKGSLKLKQVSTLVLDEADRMLDMGFLPDIEEICGFAPRKRQTLLFSATYPDAIQAISRKLQEKPTMIEIDLEHENDVIEQLFYEVNKHERNNTLLTLFHHYKLSAAIVFCHTKVQCNHVATFLNDNKIQAMAIHGDFEQRDRDRTLMMFANGSCPVLVATDVAARGLDIKSLPAVINYELPRDPEVYVHRTGRTGRAGETGLALSIYSEPEVMRLRAIEEFQGTPCICDTYASLDQDPAFVLKASMRTIEINAGRKSKMRPGDILGALTGDGGLDGSDIGKINISEMSSYVAVSKNSASKAEAYLNQGRVKARNVRARLIN